MLVSGVKDAVRLVLQMWKTVNYIQLLLQKGPITPGSEGSVARVTQNKKLTGNPLKEQVSFSSPALLS